MADGTGGRPMSGNDEVHKRALSWPAARYVPALVPREEKLEEAGLSWVDMFVCLRKMIPLAIMQGSP